MLNLRSPQHIHVKRENFKICTQAYSDFGCDPLNLKLVANLDSKYPLYQILSFLCPKVCPLNQFMLLTFYRFKGGNYPIKFPSIFVIYYFLHFGSIGLRITESFLF